MRIALVHYTYLPVIAGVELVMAAHARLLAQAGHEVTIICGGNQEAVSAAAKPPLYRVAIVPAIGDRRASGEIECGSPGTEFSLATEELKTTLRPILGEQEIVILHNVLTMHFQLALTAALWELADELPAVRFIAWIHDLAAVNPDYAPLPLDREPWARLKQAHPRCTYVAVSELRRQQFIELTAQPSARCRAIPNGVDPTEHLDLPPRIADLAERHSLLERDFVLLHPTRLLRRKNVELTLQVTAALHAAGCSCAALITAPPEIHHPGSGEYEAGLRELRERLGLWNDALFLNDSGPLLDDELHALFRLADALFFPSRQEGFGLPLLEAALHRLPIFCSDIAPLNALLEHGVTTFSLDSTPDEIAASIIRVLDPNPAFAARKQTVQSHSWNAIYRNFLSPLLTETESP